MNNYLHELSKMDLWERLGILCSRLKRPVVELWHGITKGTLPWARTLTCCLILQLILLFRIDLWLISQTSFLWLYPKNMNLYHAYYFVIISSPFWTWAFFQARKRERLNKILTDIFKSSGLQNNLGNLPAYIFDKPVDSTTRKLRVTRAVLPMTAFQRSKDALEGGLHAFIDEFRENRAEGIVDIIYSQEEMTSLCKIGNYEKIPSPTFYVGSTRSKEIMASLDSCPHLLIAGQTGGGKSTFIRQLAVTLYLNDPDCFITFIDFKGSVEAELFENLPRVQIPQTMKKAIYFLEVISKSLEYRLALLKANRCKDVSEYLKIPKAKRVSLRPDDDSIHPIPHRHIIIVDEAAELFLASEQASGEDVQKAKRILSRIARQGRSIGVHLVLATQRPDSRALDPQIKANLTGILCFQMVNDTSSILVLGNGRATDLPPVPGRAIWKSGMEMMEVQTPYLEWDEAEELLKKDYAKPTDNKPALNAQQPADNHPSHGSLERS
ncbi:MAG: hypothetical protein HY537_05650 [Deltaproteobacteria bacterium]|nr:hypothetical protein [Deltaproteobacteria bacterium]